MKDNHERLVKFFVKNAENMKVKHEIMDLEDGIMITHVFANDNFIDVKILNNLQLDLVHEVGTGHPFETPYEEENVSVKKCIELLTLMNFQYNVEPEEDPREQLSKDWNSGNGFFDI